MAKKSTKKISKDDLKEYAKSLYFEVDSEGKRVYSFRNISTRLLHEFDINIHFSTIGNWAKADNWDALFLKIKQHGIEKAKTTVEQKENEIIQKQGDIHANIQRSHNEIFEIVRESILKDLKEDPTIRFEAKVKAFEITTATLLKMNPIEDNKVEQSIDKLINSLDEATLRKFLEKLGA